MRYLLNNKTVSGANQPILFYCGNEAPIDEFYRDTGFITDRMAKNLSGLVVYAEHRYYGKSMPFGDQSFNKDNVKFLTVDQTLMDYVKLIQFIKSDANYKDSPVIAFGGSYGGMLAAWFRIKYPHIVYGAHAASAPILFFPRSVSPYAFNDLATRSYNVDAHYYCGRQIKASLNALKRWADDSSKDYYWIKYHFKTCTVPASSHEVYNLMSIFIDGFGTMA